MERTAPGPEAEVGDELVGAVGLAVAISTTRPADDEQQRVGSSEGGKRPDRHVGTLERLDPSDEQQHRSVGRQLERGACAGLVAGREERVLDTRRDDLDAALRIAVEAPELALLLGAADADRVGARDDLGLGPVAPDRLRVAALGLDASERVERRDERDVEDVLEAVGDDAAEPVVGMNDVGAAVGLQVLEHPVGELVEDVGERLLGEVVRPGLDVDDAMTGLDEHLGREPGAIGSGVRGALDTRLGERRHHFAHVDVHPTAVARTGLSERRRVERDHGHSLHNL